MLNILFKGIIIGVLVSAPMGPVGILCVQRTLNRGRWHGFASGLGAVLSDIVYAFFALLGISLITDFLEKQEHLVQLAGSIILVVFGYLVYRSNPLKNMRPTNSVGETRYTKDFVTAFLLTASNIMIIFVFLTLYAQFNFNPIEDGGLLWLAISMSAIAVGAVIWWFCITSFFSHLRTKVSRRGLSLMNKVVGLILAIIGITGILSRLW